MSSALFSDQLFGRAIIKQREPDARGYGERQLRTSKDLAIGATDLQVGVRPMVDSVFNQQTQEKTTMSTFRGADFSRYSQVEVALIGYPAEHRNESLLTIRKPAAFFVFLRRGGM